MAGVEVKSNAAEVAAELDFNARSVRGSIETEVAEAAIRFQEDLRGPAPGAGLTPFRTGNLQTTGRADLDGMRFSYVNDARPYSPSSATQGDRIKINRGRESYASYAHFSGEPSGQFERDAGEAFAKHFGPELEERAERMLLELLG